MTTRPTYTVTLKRRDDPKYGEMFNLDYESTTVCSRPSEAAARKAAELYQWTVVEGEAEA